jgi:hypothetical protein
MGCHGTQSATRKATETPDFAKIQKSKDSQVDSTLGLQLVALAISQMFKVLNPRKEQTSHQATYTGPLIFSDLRKAALLTPQHFSSLAPPKMLLSRQVDM